jgi:RES domain
VSGDRQTPSLGWPPEDPAALSGFPTRRLSPTTVFYRIVRRGNGPWWFGGSMQGRFDLPTPEGTCYLATDEIAALLEVLGPDLESGAVSAGFLADRRLRKLRLPVDPALSDLTAREAVHFGITAEIGTIVPYACPQAWAAKLRAAGSPGLVSWARHDPSRREMVALFGAHGERKGWRKGREQAISGPLVERLERECGIEVIDLPRSDELVFLGD